MPLTSGALFNPSVLNNVQILAVDNDRDTGALYKVLFEDCGVEVTTAKSIKEALALLNGFVPDVLICEVRFLGESVEPLIQQTRYIAQNTDKIIPIFVVSTFPGMSLAEHLKVKVEAYQIKPIDIVQFVDKVWNLVLLSKIAQPLIVHDWVANLGTDETSWWCAGV